MADVKWTEAQQDAICARQGTVLVAAAAGSGKTAVLVQRALERLTDPNSPTSADRMLIVTFTKAAAAEMRARLEKRLSELLRKNPSDPLLRRQSLLLSQAHIGTVDSFCAEMVREFFHLIDLSPDFKIMSDKQKNELVSEAVNEAAAEAFDNGTVIELANAFANERSDDSIIKMVLTLYNFMQSHPFPEKWLREKTELYFKGDTAQWDEVILEYVRESAEHFEGICTAAIREAEEAGGKIGDVFGEVFEADRTQLIMLKQFAEQGDWDNASAFLRTIAWQRKRSVPKAEQDEIYTRLDSTRTQMKKAVKELETYLYGTHEECVNELRAAAPIIEQLANLTLDFSRRYDEKKRARNFLDYNDLEHFAVQLFLTDDGERTETAAEVAARFDEIMIDELQDTNEVQDSLFRAISKNSENLFMVGDVKQSIYGFRRAMPEIFLAHRAAFQKYDREKNAYPAYIVLDRNFRSRKEVTDSVNFVFSQLMSAQTGGIDYTGEERLVCGADYPEKPGCETEVVFLSRTSDDAPEAAEADWIAEKIKKMMADGFTVTDKNGERPADFGDFCILLRSANEHAYTYAQELQRLGVPARAAVTGGFFSAAEVNVMLSLLQVIDNPNQDIPLLAVLMSPIYGFSADDAARLRVENNRVSVYTSLVRAAKTDRRCAAIIAEIAEYRSIAATMPADAFLTLLFERTGYTDMVLAMDNGAGRIENLRLLEAYAKEYEGSGYHGISGFVRFLDRLRSEKTDLQAGEASPDGSSAVSVMSIHKSKGLEFPVCIVAGCGRKFVSDRGKDVLLHPRLGLGVKLRDPRRSARFTTTVREAIGLETDRNSAAEELRVLYVAMTRAKEKLIMLGSGTRLDRTAEKLGVQVTDRGVSSYAVRNAASAMEWLMLCAMLHPNGDKLRKIAGCDPTVVCREDYTPWEVALCEYTATETAEDEQPAIQPAEPDMELYGRIKRSIAFGYPHSEALGVPAKVAASKLAAEQGARRKITLSRPAWMGEKGMTPAGRGTALHEFMQFADFNAALADPKAELERLVAQAYLTPEQAAAVDLNRVSAFVKGELGRRVLASPRVERERRFTAVIPASMARPDITAEDTVILQGAVDCIFEENGVLNIIDFKTDRVKTTDELWELYAPQLRLYAAAMEEVMGMKVGEMILYSTHLNEASGRRYVK